MNPRVKAILSARIKETLATVIVRDLCDPRLGLVTVTGVELSPELDHAKVLVGVLGDDGVRSRTMAALGDARGYLQNALARVLETRRVPRLVFVYDESLATADRVAKLIRQARSEDDDAARQRGDESGAPETAPDPAPPPAE